MAAGTAIGFAISMGTAYLSGQNLTHREEAALASGDRVNL